MPAHLDFSSRRSPIYCSNGGIVSTSQPLASAAAASLLAKGGNAADAAVAAAAALAVTEPCSTGIGGDCFVLYYSAKSKKVTALLGNGAAPKALSLSTYMQSAEGKSTAMNKQPGEAKASAHDPTHACIPRFSANSVTVPGACRGWEDTVQQFGSGKVSLADILRPAIALATDGYPVSDITAHSWAQQRDGLLNAPNGHELLVEADSGRRAPLCGEKMLLRNMGETLRKVADGGSQAFYEGTVGRSIVETLQSMGGLMTMDDLVSHKSVITEPICVKYRDHSVFEVPPPTQGLAALQGLSILESLDVSVDEPLSISALHKQIEAMRLAFADAEKFICDPSFRQIPIQQLLSRQYCLERSQLFSSTKAMTGPSAGKPMPSSDTVQFCAVDSEGNGCSMINSNYMGFGSCIVPRGCGFTLQNRGTNFNLTPDHPNCLEGGKKPYHTIIPGLITYPNGDLHSTFGVMGGFMQPQGHMQVVSHMIDNSYNPQEALDAPRFCLLRDAQGTIALEQGFDDSVVHGLEKLGHVLTSSVASWSRSTFGRGQIIQRDCQSGVLTAGSDGRADGCAIPVPEW